MQALAGCGKLKDDRVPEEFANKLSGNLGVFGILGDPEELCNATKTTILDVARGRHGTHNHAEELCLPRDTGCH